MSALALLREADSYGVRFSVAPPQTLKAIGNPSIIQTLAGGIQRHKAELIELLDEWDTVQAAINACCDARGDSEGHRTALLGNCRAEANGDWPWLADYFQREAEAWRRVSSLPKPALQAAVTQSGRRPCGECRHYQPSLNNPTGGMGSCAIQAHAQSRELLLHWTALNCGHWSDAVALDSVKQPENIGAELK